VLAAEQAWMLAGLPNPRGCEVPRWATVDADELEERCAPLAACARGLDHLIKPQCVIACTSLDEMTAYYSGPPGRGFVPVTERETQIHETFHVWSACVFGRPDTWHQNTRIWEDAVSNSEGRDR
jgi:hypothetical protein